MKRFEGKRAVILVEEDFEDVELTQPRDKLTEKGVDVKIAGKKAGERYRGKRGKEAVTADLAAGEVNINEYDALIIPGGYAPDKMRLHQPMVDLARQAWDAGKIIAAVCHGPQLLISAGLAREKRMTSWPSVAIDLKNAGAEWVDEEVVQDGTLITSRSPADLPAFSEAILNELGEGRA